MNGMKNKNTTLSGKQYFEFDILIFNILSKIYNAFTEMKEECGK
jgi:hypothetical protein